MDKNLRKNTKGATVLVQKSHRESTSQNDPVEPVYEGKESKPLKLNFVLIEIQDLFS